MGPRRPQERDKLIQVRAVLERFSFRGIKSDPPPRSALFFSARCVFNMCIPSAAAVRPLNAAVAPQPQGAAETIRVADEREGRDGGGGGAAGDEVGR